MRQKRSSADEPAAEAKKKKTDGDEDEFCWTFDQVSCVYVGQYRGGGRPGSRIAAFDFDGTLSVPKSGKTFPQDGQDFQLLDQRLESRLKEVGQERRFVIFTNQMGVGKHTTSDAVRDRIQGILKLLGSIPCIVFASTFENEYRKPRTGMFELFVEQYNAGIGIDLCGSVYVGDAAGRKKTECYSKRDHSDADYLFALNCGLKFMTPEQFLAGHAVDSAHQENEKSLPRPPYDPKHWLTPKQPFCRNVRQDRDVADEQSFALEWEQICKLNRVVLVLIGVPGAGKSHFARRFCSGWPVVSRDAVGTMDKCEKELKAAVQGSLCQVVVDNTNCDTESRKRWLAVAQQTNCTPVAVHVHVDVDQALHNNCFRRLVQLKSGNRSAKTVPTFVIRKQAKDLVAPTLQEGFEHVFRIHFTPHFSDASLQKLYSQYL